jgi:hypothetical protein
MRLKILVLGMMVAGCLRLQAMDRWEALSQIESGNDDCAVGRAGEVSRFQIRPDVWRRYAAPSADWANPEASLLVALEAMKERCAAFERAHQRPPTDAEFYILWNAPAQIGHPSKAVRKRAERFCNLVKRQ